MKRSVVVCALLLSMSISWAAITWSDPVLLTELNNSTSGQIADYPHLSYDGSTLYFGRRDAAGVRQLYTATRDSVTGRFTSVTQISELASGENLYTPWVSQDGLRLYYGEYHDASEAIYLKMATRSDLASSWSQSLVFSTMHVYYDHDAFPSLSSDELTLYYASDRYKARDDFRVWKATRSSIYEQFSSPSLVTELDTGNFVSAPCLLPDGLTIYFTQVLGENRELFRATRESILDSFSAIEPLTLNTMASERFAYVTPDEFEIFYASDAGIMYAYQIPEPATMGLLAFGAVFLRRRSK